MGSETAMVSSYLDAFITTITKEKFAIKGHALKGIFLMSDSVSLTLSQKVLCMYAESKDVQEVRQIIFPKASTQDSRAKGTSCILEES